MTSGIHSSVVLLRPRCHRSVQDAEEFGAPPPNTSLVLLNLFVFLCQPPLKSVVFRRIHVNNKGKYSVDVLYTVADKHLYGGSYVIYDGEQIPEICNEFLTEFLTSANFFGMNTPEYKNEFRTIIQHFCFWLYENNFTSAKLIVNNKND